MPGKARLGPAATVPAPKAQPPAGGLISLARRPDVDADNRWQLGYRYRPEVPAGDVRNRSTLDGTYGADLGVPNPPDLRVEVVPVYLTIVDTTSTIGFVADDPAARARRIMEANTSRLLAHELWTGELADLDGSPNPRLAGADTTVLSGTLAPQKAVAALVQAMADAGMADTMLHTNRNVGIQLPDGWRNEETLAEQGFCVVSDAGYPGTGPTGQAGSWMYATEIVNVRLGEVELIPGQFRDSVDPASNTITYRAQRVGAADFAGPVFAVQVSA